MSVDRERLAPCLLCGVEMEQSRTSFFHPESNAGETDCPLSSLSWRTSYYREAWNKRHVPEGYAIVPVEPTEAMLEAGAQQASDCTDDFTAHSSCIAGHVWSEMLTAAQGDAE